MKNEKKDFTKEILLLLKIDATSLYQRIVKRKKEYIKEFSLKRTREHFKEIFFTRYNQVTFQELVHCDFDVIVTIDRLYNSIEEMHWYLFHTQDMTNMVDDKLDSFIRNLHKSYQELILYLNAQLEVIADQSEQSQDRQEGQEQFSQDAPTEQAEFVIADSLIHENDSSETN